MTKPTLDNLYGQLVAPSSGWLMLRVPNDIVRGLYASLDEVGIELPLYEGRLDAHISVARPEELEAIGGKAVVNELGKRFAYQLGPIRTVKPLAWEGVDRVWMVSISSPELQKLRRSYGLSGLPMKGKKTLPFHMTIAVRKKGILRDNETSKAAAIQIMIQRIVIKKMPKSKVLAAARQVLERSRKCESNRPCGCSKQEGTNN